MGARMIRLIGKLLVLLAVLAMPFGMSVASAGVPDHPMSAQMPMDHCPDQATGKGHKSPFAECTMACSAALPAVYTRLAERPVIVCVPAQPAAAQSLDGLHPDIATPPPKAS
jgi:hypothetical protein